MFDKWRIKRELIKLTKSGDIEWHIRGRVAPVREAKLADGVYVYNRSDSEVFFHATGSYPGGEASWLFRSLRVKHEIDKRLEPPRPIKEIKRALQWK